MSPPLPPSLKPSRPSPVVEVIKEDAAHAARLAAVRDKEVIVAGQFHLVVPGGVVAVAHGLQDSRRVA